MTVRVGDEEDAVIDDGLSADEVARRFTYYPPEGQEKKTAHEEVRALGRGMATRLVELVPPGDERRAAVHAVEAAVMWANAALARPARVVDQDGA